MKKMSDAQKWKIATREAIQAMNPSGFIEMPGNRFLVMFDRELFEQEKEKLKILNFKDAGKAYAYTYNPKVKLKGLIRIFDAEILAVYDSCIIYDSEVEKQLLEKIPNLNFRFKTLINLYQVSYKTGK